MDRNGGEPIGSSRYYDLAEDGKRIVIGYTFLGRNDRGGDYSRRLSTARKRAYRKRGSCCKEVELMWTKDLRALLNGIRHPHPADPPALDLRSSSWAELRAWAQRLPSFEASVELGDRFAQVAASLSEEEPPSTPLDAQEELFRYRLLTDAWEAKRGMVKRSATIAALRLDELSLLRRSIATFWASTDIEFALSLLHTHQEFAGCVSTSGTTRYEPKPARGKAHWGDVLTAHHVSATSIWAGLRRVLFSLPEGRFTRVSAIMGARLEQMADDPSCDPSTLWSFRAGFSYATARSPAAAHELAETFIDVPRLRLECRAPDCVLAAMTDADLARRFFEVCGRVGEPSFGVSVWLDAAEGLGQALAPMLEALITRSAGEYSEEQLWCVRVAQQALAPDR